MYCGHGCKILWPPHSLANPLLICLLQTHQGENVEVKSHRGTASPLTTRCRVEEGLWYVSPFAGRFVLDWCLYLLASVKTEQMVTSGGLICMVGDAKMLSSVKFAASIGGTEPGSPRTSVSLLPAVRSIRFTARYWWFSSLSIISDSDHKTSWWEREDCNSI